MDNDQKQKSSPISNHSFKSGKNRFILRPSSKLRNKSEIKSSEMIMKMAVQILQKCKQMIIDNNSLISDSVITNLFKSFLRSRIQNNNEDFQIILENTFGKNSLILKKQFQLFSQKLDELNFKNDDLIIKKIKQIQINPYLPQETLNPDMQYFNVILVIISPIKLLKLSLRKNNQVVFQPQFQQKLQNKSMISHSRFLINSQQLKCSIYIRFQNFQFIKFSILEDQNNIERCILIMKTVNQVSDQIKNYALLQSQKKFIWHQIQIHKKAIDQSYSLQQREIFKKSKIYLLNFNTLFKISQLYSKKYTKLSQDLVMKKFNFKMNNEGIFHTLCLIFLIRWVYNEEADHVIYENQIENQFIMIPIVSLEQTEIVDETKTFISYYYLRLFFYYYQSQNIKQQQKQKILKFILSHGNQKKQQNRHQFSNSELSKQITKKIILFLHQQHSKLLFSQYNQVYHQMINNNEINIQEFIQISLDSIINQQLKRAHSQKDQNQVILISFNLLLLKQMKLAEQTHIPNDPIRSQNQLKQYFSKLLLKNKKFRFLGSQIGKFIQIYNKLDELSPIYQQIISDLVIINLCNNFQIQIEQSNIQIIRFFLKRKLSSQSQIFFQHFLKHNSLNFNLTTIIEMIQIYKIMNNQIEDKQKMQQLICELMKSFEIASKDLRILIKLLNSIIENQHSQSNQISQTENLYIKILKNISIVGQKDLIIFIIQTKQIRKQSLLLQIFQFIIDKFQSFNSQTSFQSVLQQSYKYPVSEQDRHSLQHIFTIIKKRNNELTIQKYIEEVIEILINQSQQMYLLQIKFNGIFSEIIDNIVVQIRQKKISQKKILIKNCKKIVSNLSQFQHKTYKQLKEALIGYYISNNPTTQKLKTLANIYAFFPQTMKQYQTKTNSFLLILSQAKNFVQFPKIQQCQEYIIKQKIYIHQYLKHPFFVQHLLKVKSPLNLYNLIKIFKNKINIFIQKYKKRQVTHHQILQIYKEQEQCSYGNNEFKLILNEIKDKQLQLKKKLSYKILFQLHQNISFITNQKISKQISTLNKLHNQIAKGKDFNYLEYFDVFNNVCYQIDYIFQYQNIQIIQDINSVILQRKKNLSKIKNIFQKSQTSDLIKDLKQCNQEENQFSEESIKDLELIIQLQKIFVSNKLNLFLFKKLINYLQKKNKFLSSYGEGIGFIDEAIKLTLKNTQRSYELKQTIKTIKQNSTLIIQTSKSSNIYQQYIKTHIKQKKNGDQNLKNANNQSAIYQQINQIFYNNIYYMNRLKSIKDQCILYKNNQSKLKDNQIKQTNIFQEFQNFVQILESINKSNVKLINYGYFIYNKKQLNDYFVHSKISRANQKQKQMNQLIFQQSYELSNSDIFNEFEERIQIKILEKQKLKKYQKQQQQKSQQWIKSIKNVYENSFFITHFIGSNLLRLIDKFYNRKRNQQLTNLIGIDKQQQQTIFNKQINFPKQSQIISKFQQRKKYLEKIQHVNQVFKNKTQIFKNSLNKSTQRYNFLIIQCKQKDMYPLLFQNTQRQSNQNKLIHITQLLICHNQTTFEQLEIFFYRSVHNNDKSYYIIQSQKLDQFIKDRFRSFLNQYINKCRNSSRQIKQHLCFLDYNFENHKINLLLQKKQKNKQIIFKKITKYNLEKEWQSCKYFFQKSKLRVQIVTSKQAGSGKSYYIQQQTKKQGKSLTYLSLFGRVQFSSLINKLKKYKLSQKNNLCIQLGYVQNCDSVEIFLSQIILFRCFYYGSYLFLPKQSKIFIQIQSRQNKQFYQNYNILQILKDNNNCKQINQFSEKQIKYMTKEDRFCLTYLFLLNNKNINNIQLQFKYFCQKQQLNKDNSFFINIQVLPKQTGNYELKEIKINQLQKNKLIKKWFIDPLLKSNKNKKPTFWTYRFFMNMLFTTFKIFSQCQFYKIKKLEKLIINKFPDIQELEFNQIRSNYLKKLVHNSISSVGQQANLKFFIDEKSQVNKNIYRSNQYTKMILVPRYDLKSFQFVCLSQQNISPQIMMLYLAEKNKLQKQIIDPLEFIKYVKDLFKSLALNNLSQDQQQKQIMNILRQIGANKIKNQKDSMKQIYKKEFDFFKVTLDCFFKMCLILQKAFCNIPVLIMGQPGVGKTALITYLIRNILNEELQIFNINAGIQQRHINNWISKIVLKNKNKQQRIWIFFDQFNTTSCLSYLKQIIIDRRFDGQLLQKKFIFLAACNPHRTKQNTNRCKAGLKLIQKNHERNNLAFQVIMPPMTLILNMWNYEFLTEYQTKLYTMKILQTVQFSQKDKLIELILKTHQYFKKNIQISSVSLRDIQRFKQIYHWFQIYMPSSPHESLRKPELYQESYSMNRNDKSVILSYIFCYCLRLPTMTQRRQLMSMFQDKIKYQKGHLMRILQNQQTDYVLRLNNNQENIAINSALKQNIFTLLVCLSCKIPILIIGNPGSSKSLSINMIIKFFKNSSKYLEFSSQFKQFIFIHYQCTQASTSEGMETVFKKVQFYLTSQQYKNEYNICLVFDELGVAQRSKHNPLKVLHPKIQINDMKFSFVGLSNYQLDAAKMSRCLIVGRSNPDFQQMKQTAVKISRNYLKNNYKVELFTILANYYSEFIKKWNNYSVAGIGFFGLRDFYCFIKQISIQISKKMFNLLNQYHSNSLVLNDIISRAINANFDGQQSSLILFHKIADIKFTPIDSIKLIHENMNLNGRCILIILRGDSLIPLVKQSIQKREDKNRVVIICGSSFPEDHYSQSYALQKISIILNYVSDGYVIAFKNLPSSIETALYDLFNKSYTKIFGKSFCKVAVGAVTKSRANVGDNFHGILFKYEEEIPYMDLALINRFEKHKLNLQNFILPNQVKLKDIIEEWIASILNFCIKISESKLQQQNFLLNSSQQSIYTLIFKYRYIQDESIKLKNIKIDLLKNSTNDLILAFKKFKQEIDQQKKKVNQKVINQLKDIQFIQNQLKNKKNNIKKNFSTINDNYIVFTYSQECDLNSTNKEDEEQNYSQLKFSEIKSQKFLRQKLVEYLKKENKNFYVYLNYQNHYKHINFLIYLIQQIKTAHNLKTNVVIVIILHRFSLQYMKIKHINISYLHKYQQYFIQITNNLHNQQNYIDSIQKLLDFKNQFQLYTQLKPIEDSVMFSRLFNQSYNFIAFIIKNNAQNSKQIESICYQRAMNLSKNPEFQKITNEFIKEVLYPCQINLSILQTNYDHILQCSNLQEEFRKYIEERIKQIMFFIYKIFAQNDALFYFQRNQHNNAKYLQMVGIFNKNNVNNQQEIKMYSWLSQFWQQSHWKFQLVLEQQRKIIKQFFQKYIQNWNLKSIKQNHQFLMKKHLNKNQIKINYNLGYIPGSLKNSQYILNSSNFLGQNNSKQLTTLQSIAISQKQKKTNNQDSRINDIFDSIVKQNKFVQIDKLTKEQQIIYIIDFLNHYLENIYKLKSKVYQMCSNKQKFKVKYAYIKSSILLLIVNYISNETLVHKLRLIVQDTHLLNRLIDFYSIILLKEFQSSKMKTIQFSQSFKIKQFNKGLSQLFEQLFKKAFQVVNLNGKTEIINAQQYAEYFRKIYMKIRDVSNSYQLNCPSQFIIQGQFLFFLQQFDNQQLLRNLEYFKKIYEQNKGLSYSCIIFKFILIIIPQYYDNVIVIEYLSYKLFPSWLKQQNDKNQKVDKRSFQASFDNVVKQYAKLVNSSIKAANNSNYFMMHIFRQLQKVNIENYDAQIYSYRERFNAFIQENNFKQIIVNNYFSRAIVNYFYGLISNSIFSSNQFKTANDSKVQLISILEKHYKRFQKYLKKIVNNQYKLLGLYYLAFCKFYVQIYIDQFTKHLGKSSTQLNSSTQNSIKENQQVVSGYNCLYNIDKILSLNSINTETIRFYMMKILWFKNKPLNQFRSKCDWIKQCQQYLIERQKQSELIDYLSSFGSPFNFQLNQNSCKQILNLIKNAVNNSPENQFKILTFLMINFYFRKNNKNKINEALINSLLLQIQKNQTLSKDNNIIFKMLMKKYLTSDDKTQICGKTRLNNQNSQIYYLTMLNYLNIIISLRKKNNIFLKAIFNEDGKIIPKLAQKLKLQSLIINQRDPSISHIEYLIQCFPIIPQQKKLFKKCSQNCNYIFEIQNQKNQKQRITNLSTIQICPICSGQINKENNTKQYDLLELKTFLSFLKNKINCFSLQYNTIGNQIIKSLDEIKKKFETIIQLKKKVTNQFQGYSVTQMFPKKLFIVYTYLVWGFLIQSKLIDDLQCQKLFNLNLKDSSQFCFNVCQNYLSETTKIIFSKNQNERNSLIWHIQMGKQLFQFIKEMNDRSITQKLSSQQRQHQFQVLFQNRIVKYYEEDKQLLINRNQRVIEEGKINILKQSHPNQNQIPNIFLLKYIPRYNNPNIFNLVKIIGTDCQKKYPLLTYFLRNYEINVKHQHIKTIYVFLEKLHKTINYKLMRQQGKKQINQIIQYIQKESNNQNKTNNNELKKIFTQFLRSWKYFLNRGYEFIYDDRTLGKLYEVNQKTPIINLLIDQNSKSNSYSHKLIAFLQKTAKQYNKMLKFIQNIIKKKYVQYKNYNFFDQILLNPTDLNDNKDRFFIIPQKTVQKSILKYSSFSVDYSTIHPCYALNQIQGELIKQISKMRYLDDSRANFNSIKFIGEQFSIIEEVRKFNQQVTLQSTKQLPLVKQYFKQLRKQSKFYQMIKDIQKDLQNIICFRRNQYSLKSESARQQKSYYCEKQTIIQYIEKNKLIECKKIEGDLGKIKMQNLIDLYQFVEYQTFQKIIQFLEPPKDECSNLNYEEIKNLNSLIVKMKQNNPSDHKLPTYSHFKQAIYRFAGRNLATQRQTQNINQEGKHILVDKLLCEGSIYWSKDEVMLSKLPFAASLNDFLSSISFQKIRNLLQKLPFFEQQDHEDNDNEQEYDSYQRASEVRYILEQRRIQM